MSTPEVGEALWRTVRKVQRRLGGKGTQVTTVGLAELARRTRCAVPAEATEALKMLDLSKTAWWRTMKQRYEAVRAAAFSSAAESELAEVMAMYGGGVAWRQVPETLASVVSMLTEVKISESHVETEASKLIAQRKKVPTERATTAELSGLLKEIVANSSAPKDRWWETDDFAKAVEVSVVKTAIRTDPPAVLVVYRDSVDGRVTPPGAARRVRHRVVKVDGFGSGFSETGPVTQVAKRLARSHGALLSEEAFAALLLRLQRAIRDQKAAEEEAKATGILPATHRDSTHHFNPLDELGSSPPVHAEVPGVKKADIGLLFRDPEAALRDVDLQEADEITVKEYKLKMEDTFQANIVRPGDPGYRYDVRVQAKPIQTSEWDED